MKPYPSNNLPRYNLLFNYRLRDARPVIESTFGNEL